MDVAFFASRYDKGDADYINCPMTEEQYNAFWQALITAEEAPLKDYEKNYIENEKDPIVSLLCMKSLETKLPENQFCRVHRSYIVQTSKCKVIEKGRIVIGNNTIPISDSYRASFFERLQNVAIEV